MEAFLAEAWKFDTTKTVQEALAGQIAVIGENMNIRRFTKAVSYTHLAVAVSKKVEVE